MGNNAEDDDDCLVLKPVASTSPAAADVRTGGSDRNDPGVIRTIERIFAASSVRIEIDPLRTCIGPRITRYSYEVVSGDSAFSERSKRRAEILSQLGDYFKVQGIRFDYGWLEVPDANPTSPSVADLLESDEWKKASADPTYIPLLLGVSSDGKPVVAQLGATGSGGYFPHMMICGQVGSGKSELLNTILTALHTCRTPKQLRVVVLHPHPDFFVFEKSPLLNGLVKYTHEHREAVAFMEQMKAIVQKRRTGHDDNGLYRTEPNILFIIDNYECYRIADTRKEEFKRLVEDCTSLGRGAHVHLLVVGSSASSKFLGGGNIDGRISFHTDRESSRYMIGVADASRLMPVGDALYREDYNARCRRVQIPVATDEERKKSVDICKARMSNPAISGSLGGVRRSGDQGRSGSCAEPSPAADLPGRMIRAQCGNCGEPFEFKMCDMVDVTGRPKLKEWVLSQRLFTHVCRKCNRDGVVPYAFTYVDNEKSLLVKVRASRSEALAAEDSKSNVDNGGWDEAWRAEGEHDVRVAVGSLDALAEMIRIVDAGLDPYVVMWGKLALTQDADDPAKKNIMFEGYDPNLDGGSLKYVYLSEKTRKMERMTLFRSAYDAMLAELCKHDYEPLRMAEVVDLASISELVGRCASMDVEPSEKFKQLKAAAKGRDGQAWFALGVAYYNGEGIRQNRFKAFRCFREGAEAGDAEAQSALATCYIHGLGTAVSSLRAGSWYSAAAKQGNPDGLYGKGLLAHYGSELDSVDYAVAKDWYEKAIAAGHARANFSLGALYEEGLGVPKDPRKALELYRVAKERGEQGVDEAYERVRKIVESANGGVATGAEEKTNASGKGDNPMCEVDRLWWENRIRQRASQDRGCEKSELEEIEKAAKAKNAEAQYVMGLTYEKGEVVGRDFGKAREWYEKSSMNGFPKATMAVARFFEKGIGEEAHVGTAYEWYKFALEEQGWEGARPSYERMKRKLEDQERAASGEPNLRKVAIVGVDGSGKTVMLAGLGDLYAHPDANGFFLAPKDFGTSAYVNRQISLMRAGHWPKATVGDEMKGLNWLLRRKKDGGRPVDVCEVSFLDFAGEVYRAAFGINHADDSHELSAQIEQLKSYVRNADDLIVLINLKDVIAHGLTDRRTEEAMWISNSILEYALNDKGGGKIPRASIVLSQADSYADTIGKCGGADKALAEYLPHVANDYSWLDIFAASAVDKTHVDDDGELVPSPDFKTNGLSPVMTWILRGVAPGVVEQSPNLFADAVAEVEAGKKPTDPFEIPIAEIEQELYHSGYREITPQEAVFLMEAANGDPVAAQRKMKRAAKDWFEKGEKYERRSHWIFFNAKRNHALAVECWTKAAELKYRPAQKRLGDFYSDLDNKERDYEVAHKWYLAAARQGEPEAQFEVGKRLNRYMLAPPSDESRLQALKWFRLSADQGHLGSLCQLGCFREHGYCGVRVDDREAYSWYQKAVDGGYKYGATYLIKLHKKHEDYPIDYAKVAPLLQKATANDIESMILYGELLENGLGVAKNLQLALQFYRCAAGDNSNAEVAVARVLKKIGKENGN